MPDPTQISRLADQLLGKMIRDLTERMTPSVKALPPLPGFHCFDCGGFSRGKRHTAMVKSYPSAPKATRLISRCDNCAADSLAEGLHDLAAELRDSTRSLPPFPGG